MSARRTPAPKHVDRDRRQTPGRIHPAAGDVFEAFTAGEKSLGTYSSDREAANAIADAVQGD
jgi:hypothetical protein